jgi:hypothetical protein
MEIAYVAVSSPVFARLISRDLLEPSKTALLGVIRRFPCALRLLEKRIEIKIAIEMETSENFNPKECEYLNGKYNLIRSIEYNF